MYSFDVLLPCYHNTYKLFGYLLLSIIAYSPVIFSYNIQANKCHKKQGASDEC